MGLTSVADLQMTPSSGTILDVRWTYRGPSGLDEYLSGHLPGAVFVDLDTMLCGPAGPAGRRPIPAEETFTESMRRLGVWQGQRVIVYDGGDSTAAARAWWLLRYFGHPDVQVLDGGYAAWLAAGLPVQTGGVVPAAGNFRAVAGHMPVIDAAEAARLARHGTLLDARPADRYRTAGHIPGARSASSLANVDSSGRFHPTETLRARFADVGEHVGVYCGSGLIATHTILALARCDVDASLYLGSWSQWTADPDRPVARGPEPG